MAKPKQKILTKYRYIIALALAAKDLYEVAGYKNFSGLSRDEWIQLKKEEWLEKAEGLLK